MRLEEPHEPLTNLRGYAGDLSTIRIAQCSNLISVRLGFPVLKIRNSEHIARVVRSLRQVPKLRELVLSMHYLSEEVRQARSRSFAVAIEDAILELGSLKAVQLTNLTKLASNPSGKWISETRASGPPFGLTEEYPRLHAKGKLVVLKDADT